MSSISYIDQLNECWSPSEIMRGALLLFGVAIIPPILYILAFKLAGLQ